MQKNVGGWLIMALLCAGAPRVAEAQTDTVTLAANPEYLAGGVWEWIWGRDYRKSWSTPIRVPVLDLSVIGLTPLRRGGGLQTRSLRFAGADGREYSFRSVDKDPTAVLPDELKGTVAADVVKDQISAQHPYGALVADSILAAVGVLHVGPRLFVMPDAPELGEFRQDFAGVLGFIEERPDENDNDLASFYGARRVIGTERLFERIDEHASDRVDAVAYLRARLVDFLLGDWDRHRDQWRWAQFGDGPWQPIPRDRDQAFSRLDGLIPSQARFVVPQLVGFSDDYVSIFSLSWSGRETDRRFLAELERPAFDSLAQYIQGRVTDEVIDGAVARLPPEVEALDGPALRRRLRGRRDRLGEAARRFYEQLAAEVDLHASDDDEVLVLEQDDQGRVALTLATAEEPERPYVVRTFTPLETSEVRIRLHGGDDVVRIRGGARMPMPVRVVLGGGDDAVHYQTPTRGVVLYDERGRLTVDGDAPPLDLRRRPYDEWNWSEDDPVPRRDWGQAILAAGDFGVSSDYGLLLGVGASRTRFGFRRDPYATHLKGVFAAATNGKIDARLDLDVRLESSPAHVYLHAAGTQLDVIHYYGQGNDTEAPEPDEYYDVQQARVGMELGFGTRIGSQIELRLAPRLVFNKTGDNQGRLIDAMPDLYGTGSFWQFGGTLGAGWRSSGAREGSLGTLLDVNAAVYSVLAGVTHTFGSVDGVWRGYVPLDGERLSLLAFRVGGQKVWGEFPWFESAFLGGDNLRGLPAQRYAGDASLYGSAEVRLEVGSARVLVPEVVGLLGLADAGRVWVNGSSPGGWHAGFGGGIWLGLINRRNIVSAAYAVSEGGGRIHLDLGFAF